MGPRLDEYVSVGVDVALNGGEQGDMYVFMRYA